MVPTSRKRRNDHEQVLVTGGSGFLGGHFILQLLAARHDVRTRGRNLAIVASGESLVKLGLV